MPILQVKFRDKKFDIEVIDQAGESVAAEIFKYREYRRAEKVITETILPILDIGAHLGMFTIYCRALNSKIKIISLEPEDKNFLILKQNLENNKIIGVETVRAALAGSDGERVLAISDDSHNHYLSEANGENTQKVAAVTFKNLLSKFAIKQVGLLKMDIEGGEGEVLKSLSPDDFAQIAHVIMEYHEKIISRKIMENILRENGFGVEIFPSKFDKTMGFIFARNKRFKHL